ncbi:4-alpha-glucanotransferase [Chloroflexota bacterium]
MSTFDLSTLHQLARLYNVQTAYYDVAYHRQQTSIESLLTVLQALGAPVASLNEVSSALRARRQALWQRILEPVTVVWGRKYPLIKVCLPVKLTDYSLNGHLELESGEPQVFQWSAEQITVLGDYEIEGTGYVVKEIRLPEILPWGYHRFFLEIKGNSVETLIISAPDKAYTPPDDAKNRMWGAFMPLYAMQNQNSLGSGDYSTLGSLADWVSELGGQTVATLPLLPTFLDEPFEPSPYAPVSRLLWNELYINIDSVPELSESSQAKALLQSSSLLSEIKELRDASLVDYRRLMALKRRVLEECCHHLITKRSGRFQDFQKFTQANPIVEDYARFRASMEKQCYPWSSWPKRLRDGTLNEGDYEEKSKLYHMYAQWLAHRQVQDLSDGVRSRGVTLYFDLPLGTHPEGYDVWRERESFALEVTVGAPPDAVFTWGQNWLFPPLHPERIREQGYRYLTAYICHHLQHAGMLRIDHVMGLHRLFWIPKGMDASHGVYVRYRAEELYAILTLESHRHRNIIVGEDLGTVPAYVRPAMSQHGLQRMYVLHYELTDNSSDTLHRPQRNSVVSLNTHDMPPFAAFWQGLDIEERLDLGLLGQKSARSEKKVRQAVKSALVSFLRKKDRLRGKDTDVRAVFRACLSFLSASQARVLLVNLEDLWLETQSQNVPSTDNRNPNWRRKARYALEEFCQLPEVRDTLKEIDRLRKQGVK